MLGSLKTICSSETVQVFTKQIRHINANTASIAKTHRKIYAKTYPCLLVQPDGSTINIKYHEPRRIITLPLDVSTLSESEKQIRLEKRKPKIKVKIEEDIEDTYNAKKYLNYMKNKPNTK